MKKLCKCLAIILTISLILCSAPTLTWSSLQDQANSILWAAGAEEYGGYCGESESDWHFGENMSWTLNTQTGVLRITGSGKMFSFNGDDPYSDRLPSILHNCPWEDYCLDVKTIFIDSGVTSIGSYAFQGMRNLESITFGASSQLKSIETAAFYCCTSLTAIDIPSTVTSIDESAFGDCASLNAVQIPQGVTVIKACTFRGCRSLAQITLHDGITSIGPSAFRSCGFTAFSIPTGITEIESYAFSGCSFTNITIPGTVKVIKDYAFYWSSLQSVLIQQGVSEIGDFAFANCVHLNAVSFPNSLTKISGSAFSDCSGLQSFSVASGNPNYSADAGGVLFNADRTELILYPCAKTQTSYSIPGTTTTISDYAFYNQKSLKTVSFPNKLVSVGNRAFSGCTELTSITLPNSVTSVGNNAFENCEKLQKIVLSNGIDCIRNNTFNDCVSLTDITLPSGLTKIESYAFRNCDHLTNIAIPDTVNAIGGGAFAYCSLLTTVQIPSGVTGIQSEVFLECFALDNITIPNTATFIGQKAFGYCTSLKTITIPNSVTAIGSWAFDTCTALKDLQIPDSVATIGEDAFFNCNGLETIQLPASLTIVENHVFRNCFSLNSISVGTSLKQIKPYAFYCCDSLKDVYYYGSEAEWNAIDGKEYLGDVTVHYSYMQDLQAPFGSISSTNNVAASQTVTLTLTDNVGVAGYYWGTSSAYASNAYTATDNTSAAKAVSTAGTYYLTVKDTSDNLSETVSITFYKTALDARGGSVSPTSVLTQSGKSFTLPTPTRDKYTFSDWNTSSGGSGTKYTGSYTVGKSATLYAQWSLKDVTKPNGSISSTNNVAASQTVTLTLSDNVGVAGYYWGTSSAYASNAYTATGSTSATKTVSAAGTYYLTVKDTSDNLSETVSITFFKTTLDARGGSVSPTSVLTQSGKSFTLPTPTRDKYIFSNWNTSAGGSGSKYTGSYTVNAERTLYAVWQLAKNVYNLGEETYSFQNFGDYHGNREVGGHCFGMSSTSSGYYLSRLDVSPLGIDSASKLNTLSKNTSTKKAICYYQDMQEYRDLSNVAGGRYYLNQRTNITADWNELVNYVKDHSHDATGDLQIGFRGVQTWPDGSQHSGGHAINFLRYEYVNGQDRIYAYDNNYPSIETYFYYSNGNVNQKPQSTFDANSITTIALRDMNIFFDHAGIHDSTRFIYGYDQEIRVEGANIIVMEMGVNDDPQRGEYTMFEVGETTEEVTVTPLVSNAEFSYCDHTYTFGLIDEDTCGTLALLSADEYEANAGSETETVTQFSIKNAPEQSFITIKNFTSSKSVDYRTTMTFTAILENPVSGAQIHWFINGKDQGTGDQYTEKEATASYTVQAKYIKGGNTLAESEVEKVNVKTGFFAKLKAFFRALFGRLPKVVQEYLGVEMINRIYPD